MTKTCECGCGQPTTIATCTHRDRGIFKGQPYRFLAGHAARKPRPEPPIYQDDTARYIALTKNKFALVDVADHEWLNRDPWLYSGGYAARSGGKEHNGRTIFMQDAIMRPPEGMEVDHINLDKLDNRRSNLRYCTRTQNLGNVRSKKGTSQYKGVSRTRNGTWQVFIQKDRKNMYLGTYKEEVNAAKVYDAAAREHFGEFARCNFPVEPASVAAPAPHLENGDGAGEHPAA